MSSPAIIQPSGLPRLRPSQLWSNPLIWAINNVRLWNRRASAWEPFRPWPYQARLLADRAPARIVVKARQIGVSTALAIEAAHVCLFKPRSRVLLVSRNQDQAIHLLSYCTDIVKNLPSPPPLETDNRTELSFGDHSIIRSLPASKDTGRGWDGTDAYLDEFAHADWQDDIWRSIKPAVSRGRVTVVSTPNGEGNLFHKLWSGQEAGDLAWGRWEIPWQRCPVYDKEWAATERAALGSYGFAVEYECRFALPEGNIFKWYPRYLEEPRPATIVIAWDTALTATGDAWAWAAWGMDSTKRLYLLDAGRRQFDPPDGVKAMGLYAQSVAQRWPNIPVRVLVRESVPIDRLEAYHLRQQSFAQVIGVKLPRGKSKGELAALIVGHFESGRARVPESAVWLEEWIHEHKAFTGRSNSERDDQVETTIIALHYLTGMGQPYEQETEFVLRY